MALPKLGIKMFLGSQVVCRDICGQINQLTGKWSIKTRPALLPEPSCKRGPFSLKLRFKTPNILTSERGLLLNFAKCAQASMALQMGRVDDALDQIVKSIPPCLLQVIQHNLSSTIASSTTDFSQLSQCSMPLI